MFHYIKITNYNYPLPDEKIAKFPLNQRDNSKLLLNKNGVLSEHRFLDLPSLLPTDSLLIFNNTKVIQARLYFQKESGANIEIFCLEPHLPADYALSFQQKKSCQWKCFIGNAKKWKNNPLTLQTENYRLQVSKIEHHEDAYIVNFEWDNEKFSFADILESAGELPIPPYLHRNTEESDKESYQTVYAKIRGSVAAPTAGLHFTPEVLDALQTKGIETAELTLNVGAGTFKPVQSETIEEHTMHAELFTVTKACIEKLLEKQGKITAVGTTSVRSLESLYWIGAALEENPQLKEFIVTQWQAYKTDAKPVQVSPEKALQNILDYLNKNNLDHLQASTQIMIVPGYEFKIVNTIITNFHQPQSTLLLLISAYLKGNWRGMYDYALKNDFRFLSYGDSSLLIKD